MPVLGGISGGFLRIYFANCRQNERSVKVLSYVYHWESAGI